MHPSFDCLSILLTLPKSTCLKMLKFHPTLHSHLLDIAVQSDFHFVCCCVQQKPEVQSSSQIEDHTPTQVVGKVRKEVNGCCFARGRGRGGEGVKERVTSQVNLQSVGGGGGCFCLCVCMHACGCMCVRPFVCGVQRSLFGIQLKPVINLQKENHIPF